MQNEITYATLELTDKVGTFAGMLSDVLKNNNGDFTEAIKDDLLKELNDVTKHVITIMKEILD